MVKLSELKKRIIEIKYKRQDAWVGSCLNAVGIIDKIFKKKKPNEKFILSCGHAGTALYVVLESYGILTKKQAETLLSHPHLNPKLGIWCTTGSLGHGVAIALGMALANRKKKVYCLITDGECAEGICWETLRIQEDLKVDNLMVYVNTNGFGAFGPIDSEELFSRLGKYIPYKQIFFTKSKGIDDHYRLVTKEQYEKRVF